MRICSSEWRPCRVTHVELWADSFTAHKYISCGLQGTSRSVKRQGVFCSGPSLVDPIPGQDELFLLMSPEDSPSLAGNAAGNSLDLGCSPGKGRGVGRCRFPDAAIWDLGSSVSASA